MLQGILGIIVYKQALNKICSTCKDSFPATSDYFGADKRHKDGLQSQCLICQRLSRQRYRDTIRGHLIRLYTTISRRCSGGDDPGFIRYTEKGIKNKFESSGDFADYAINELLADPRGKECHRIDNDGHYEQGNIEFLGETEHRKLHDEMRGRK